MVSSAWRRVYDKYPLIFSTGDAYLLKMEYGVRSADVIIVCVTEGYTKSQNCRREVTLATELSKKIVPLLCEDIPWPPQNLGTLLGMHLPSSFIYGAADSRSLPAGQLYIDCTTEERMLSSHGAVISRVKELLSNKSK